MVNFPSILYLDIKSVLIIGIMVLIIRLLIYWKKWRRSRRFFDIYKEPYEFGYLTPEEKKLFKITKVNTNINREMPKEQDQYVQEAYELIYGNEEKIFKNNKNNFAKKCNKTKKENLM